MKKGYWVVHYLSVSNPDALAAYTELAIPAIESHGGKFIVRGFASQAFEAGIEEQRTAVIEFESVEKAIAAYNSNAYSAARKALNNGATRDFRILESLN
jgi:uncharacterized protein (DUF1330 family)